MYSPENTFTHLPPQTEQKPDKISTKTKLILLLLDLFPKCTLCQNYPGYKEIHLKKKPQ